MALNEIASLLKREVINIMSDNKTKLDRRTYAIAEKIKKLRIEAGYTNYEDFANDIEMGRMQYWRLEKGSNVTLSTLYRILDAHKISMEDFFKGL